VTPTQHANREIGRRFSRLTRAAVDPPAAVERYWHQAAAADFL